MNGNLSPLAMIFDVDGVLVHSMPLHMLAWEEYLANLGVKVDDLEARMHGKRNTELVRDLIAPDVAEDAAFEHGAAKERLFREMLLRDGIEKYRVPGLTEFLERHKNVPKAIGSNAEPKNIEFVLEQFALRSYFAVAVNGLEVSRPKPFPDIYLEAARRLHTKPENCIVFEDSPTGVEAGRTAGMRVVAVETTPTAFRGVNLQIKDFCDPQLEPWLAAQKAI
ncbi:MAG: HAD family phosphatase [Acidobacteriaceae bacterium]|nr:HAD family phosphatase [Acidobacteriaceae bacterium]